MECVNCGNKDVIGKVKRVVLSDPDLRMFKPVPVNEKDPKPVCGACLDRFKREVINGFNLHVPLADEIKIFVDMEEVRTK